MKSIWRRCLSLTAGLLAVSGQLALAEAPAFQVIASSEGQPAASLAPPVIAGRPAAVTLERPRPTNFAVQQVSYQNASQPTVRAQADEPGFAEAPTPSIVTPTLPPPGADAPMFPSMLGADAGPTLDGIMTGGGIDPDRYGIGDGVSHQFNNFITFETDALLWQMRGEHLPPLVTTGIATPAPFALGALIMPTAQVAFGGRSEGDDVHGGERSRLTIWVDRDHTIGLEGSFFFLTQETNNFSRSTDGSSVLAIPFIGTNGMPSAVVLGGDGKSVGGVSALVMNRLWGAEANIRSNILVGPSFRLDLIGGFRTLGLDDSVNLDANRITAGNPLIIQTAQDGFAARNRFYGGQIGADAEWHRGRWSLDVTSKLALGSTNETVNINGGSTLNGFPTSGGIFAQATNSNAFRKDRFSVVPEIGFKVGYQLTDYLRATAGYNFLYWTDVARAGEQIDPVLAGSGHPAFAFNRSDFWTQGLTVGLELRY